MVTKREPLFECMECGKKFYTVGAAERASFGNSGCPGCGGSDIEPYYGITTKSIGKFAKELKHHHHKTAIKKAHTHIIGKKPHKQKLVHPGVVPRNIGIYYGKKPHLKEIEMGGLSYRLVGDAQSREKANKLYIHLYPEPETQSKLSVAIIPYHVGKSADPAYSDKNGNRWVIYVAKRQLK